MYEIIPRDLINSLKNYLYRLMHIKESKIFIFYYRV